MALKWVKDVKVEHNLRILGISFEIKTGIPLEQVDMEESANRQVRLGKKVNDDWVLEMALAMKPQDGSPGADFPMVVLNKRKTGKKPYFIWSGLHRTHAAQFIGETHIDAYVVEVFDARLEDILPRVVNVWEGHGLGKDEKLINARYMIEKHSMTPQDAARLMCIKLESLYPFMRAAQVGENIERTTGISVNGLSRSVLLKLSPLSDNRNIMRETVKLVKKHALGDKMIGQITNDIRRLDTETQRLAELERWDRVLAAPKKKPEKKMPFRSTIRTAIIRDMTRLAKTLDGVDTPEKAQIVDADDVKVVVQAWTVIERQMTKILRKGGVR